MLRLKLLKDWGSHKEGDILDFGESKGLPLIDKGIAIEVKRPEVETATNELVGETAVVTPVIRRRGRPPLNESEKI